MKSKIKLLNISIDNLTEVELYKRMQKSKIIFTPNVDHLFNLQVNKSFYESYKNADLLVCDSRIIGLLYRILFWKRIFVFPGSEIFPKWLIKNKANEGFRVFLLGGTTPKHSELAAKNLNELCEVNLVTNWYSPPFGFETDQVEIERIIEKVNQSKSTVLVIGLGSPKQELFVQNFKNRFSNVNTFLCIGASIDFESGLTKKAPKIYKVLRTEWFYRFSKEPTRLFKRYFINGPRVILLIILDRFNLYSNPFSEKK